MNRGAWYTCLDPLLSDLRDNARAACFQHNSTDPSARGAMGQLLHELMASVGEGAFLEAPFHCSYGFNIHLGRAVYLNANCVILDSAPVRIGDGSMIGPLVQIYCADHHRDVDLRAAGVERALPVTLGANVWVGGGAILLPGVTVGDGAIVGAGAVVTKDVPAGSRVVGNPARSVGSERS